jgi:oxygen-independent coproporphyrinogen-3 oxidase
LADNWQIGGFGLYLHWPFCQSKCPYCDFNSHVVQSYDHDRWSRAYVAEVERHGRETPDRVLRSIYFGGGTPSLMKPKTIEDAIGAAAEHWDFANDIEITLEANPGSVEAGKFADFKAAGINRVSIGIQALDHEDLKRLGRLHSVDEGRRALAIADQVFDRFSFDLIYARQDQTLKQWRSELAEAIDIGADHMSLYQLTVEEGTAFGALFQNGKLRGLPDEDLAADMYELTQDMMDHAGFHAYEVSNHAKAGAESRHNQIYWDAGDWVGVGPGAHGRLSFGADRHATETALAPTAWLAAAENGSGTLTNTTLSAHDAAVEYLMMGLRTVSGVDLVRVQALNSEYFTNKINELIDEDLLSSENGFLFATGKGRPVLNAIIRALLPG